MFTVQDGPGPGREEDREAPGEADETDGVQGDAQRRHGDGLKTLSVSPDGLDAWTEQSNRGFVTGPRVEAEGRPAGWTVAAEMVDLVAIVGSTLQRCGHKHCTVLSLLRF